MGTLDLTGLHCPEVVLRLAECMREMMPGTRMRVISTDPLSAIDIPFFLGKAGHGLVSRSRSDGRIEFIVECGGMPAQPMS